MLAIIILCMTSPVPYKTEPYEILSIYGWWPFCCSVDTFGFLALLFSFLQMISRVLIYHIVFTNPHARSVMLFWHERSYISLVVFPLSDTGLNWFSCFCHISYHIWSQDSSIITVTRLQVAWLGFNLQIQWQAVWTNMSYRFNLGSNKCYRYQSKQSKQSGQLNKVVIE